MALRPRGRRECRPRPAGQGSGFGDLGGLCTSGEQWASSHARSVELLAVRTEYGIFELATGVGQLGANKVVQVLREWTAARSSERALGDFLAKEANDATAILLGEADISPGNFPIEQAEAVVRWQCGLKVGHGSLQARQHVASRKPPGPDWRSL